MKCQHFHICVNSYNPLCSDSKCSLIKQEQGREDQSRLESVRRAIDKYKTNEKIKSFLDRKSFNC